jgi:F-type H+-transporting ATPase subunit delta
MAQEFEAGIDVADVYAAALFELAHAAGVVDDVRAELEELLRLLEREPAIAAFFSSHMVDDDDREKSLERVFRGKLSDIVLDTLLVMNRHGRAGLVPQLLRAFVLRIEDSRGQVEVYATSAVALDTEQQKRVAQLAEQLSGKKPLVRYAVDPDVIGGLVLQIGDHRYDNSIRRHLHEVRARLFERSSRGLNIAPLVER